jgi:hypothetical protein
MRATNSWQRRIGSVGSVFPSPGPQADQQLTSQLSGVFGSCLPGKQSTTRDDVFAAC